MYTRKNQRDLSGGEKKAFVDALLTLKRTGGYEHFVSTHVRYYVPDGESGLRSGHMAPTFLPWHRRFLLEFEQALQRIDPTVSVPYWDWTSDRTPAASLWGEDFLGGTGRRSDQRVMTGPFAYATGNWRIRDNVTDDAFLTRALGRPGRDPIALPTAAELDRAMTQSVYDAAPWDSTSPRGFRNALEGWVKGGDQPWLNHNRVHRWVGGAMLGAASPNDPVFWLHHAFVDLLWDRWQRKHPKAGYLPARKLASEDPQRGRVVSLDEPMPPWGTRPSEMLGHAATYRYA